MLDTIMFEQFTAYACSDPFVAPFCVQCLFFTEKKKQKQQFIKTTSPANPGWLDELLADKVHKQA